MARLDRIDLTIKAGHADILPANTALRVFDFDGSNAGPVAFVDGAPVSGVTYMFVALGK